MAFGSWQFRRWADRWNKLSECCAPDENSLPERGGGNALLFPPSSTLLVPRSSRPLFLSLFLFSFGFVSTHFFFLFFSFFIDAFTLIGNNKRESDAIPKGNFSSSRLPTPLFPPSNGRLEDPWILFRHRSAIAVHYHHARRDLDRGDDDDAGRSNIP